MEAYGGFMEHTDHHIEQLVDTFVNLGVQQGAIFRVAIDDAERPLWLR